MKDILGISLGSRLLGVAVVYDGELIDFRVRKFYDAWSTGKRVEIMTTIETTVQRYGIKKIVVKTPKPYYCSQNITDLTDDIIALGKQLNIRVMVCTIATILRKDKESTLKNKQSLIKSIICKYPDHKRLARLSPKNNRITLRIMPSCLKQSLVRNYEKQGYSRPVFLLPFSVKKPIYFPALKIHIISIWTKRIIQTQ